MISRLTQPIHLGNAQKNTGFLIALLQKFVFILSNHKKCQTVLKLKKKVQELAADCCTTILFLNISVLLTLKLTPSKIINKFLGLFNIFPNLEENYIRNLNTQNMISLLKKPRFGNLIAVESKNQHLVFVSPHLLVKCMLKSAYKNVFYIKLHDNGSVLASSHYGKLSMKWYEQNDVSIMPKTANPSNCPELRVIEKYWPII